MFTREHLRKTKKRVPFATLNRQREFGRFFYLFIGASSALEIVCLRASRETSSYEISNVPSSLRLEVIGVALRTLVTLRLTIVSFVNTYRGHSHLAFAQNHSRLCRGFVQSSTEN